ncbi:uncharacterized protein LOC131016737 [Salvia miltiorrhiza]|uniref:uncharacterized protein LOC131016737 n=1 Tax=Salvia miltiorrhiza TaxID=226208 RepID=UPI0025ABD022|nr:uncharacterized protein LOC131016737 [Salvia miltiorrhiza]XP_057801429.1 uncharacterized protein LOC131016737 [Salvia miltiorrhiza]XP_057801430.1 uncharacterized protein LOC131016737 [Salvia miltiorrhiza]XP_057801431.1 uncharacterized protein LOC131016737 [Salvia miltiorrhiza]XP_057801432.1 uncharacterized protein LOC131016737 [Salvia miltiorrhiza]
MEIRQSSFGRAADRPSANLLAEGICKETEPKRRSLSGIARLIRREGLPALWSVHKQKKQLLDSYRLKNTSINIEPNRQLYDGQSNRRSPKKQQESKDVYEDLELSPFVNGRCSSRWSASSMLSKSEMAHIKQNLNSKRLTYDETVSEKFHDSEDLDDTLDSRDIMMQFGRKKNSFGNLVYDQRGTSSGSLGNPRALLNPPSSVKYGNAKSRRADRDITGKHNINSYPNRDDGLLLDPHYRHRAGIAHKMSEIQSKEKSKKNTLPTPIVVLKPNLGNMKNDHDSSPHHLEDCFPNFEKMTGHPSVGSVKEMSWRKTKSYYDAEFLNPVSEEARAEEARKLAKKITRQLRDAFDKSEDAIYSGFRGYAADKNLYSAEERDIDSELEMFKWSSRSSFVDDSKRSSHASSRSVNEEAKKRLAERWKLTHKYRDLEIVGQGTTLGEMLSAPDAEKRSRKTAHGHTDRSSKKVGSDNGSSIQNGLLGTISRGGSKNKSERRLRSRSVPPLGGSILGRGTCHNMLDNEKHLFHSDPISHGTIKVTKQYPSHKDHFSSQASKFNGKKPLPCPPIFIEEIDSSLEASFEIQMEANVKDLPYQQLTFQMEEKDDCSGGDVPEIVDAEHGITTLLSETSLLHPSNSSVDNESSSSTAHDQKDFCLQEVHQEDSEEGDPSVNHLGAELVSSESSKDADYASPVSVLETSFIEDASSSSENTERVSAEVSELRMQLQLLKMESEAYDNTSTHISSEKDSLSAEGWEASYILDVLIQAGLQDFGFDLFRIIWHSPDCPLDTRLFDILEEKYRNERAASRPERMLLFDRINSGLSEIFLKHVDVRPWVMSKLAGSLHLTWQKERARSTVEKLIGQESANGLQVTERILDREMQWQNPKEEIALTGNEIGELLIDDFINEFLFD